MLTSLEDLYDKAQPHVALFNAFAQKHALLGKAAADHIGYKCASRESYEHNRVWFEETAEYSFQTMISGRRVSTIKLKQPLDTTLGPIWFLELSDQKPDTSQTEGFDHAEIYPTGISYEGLIHHIEQNDEVQKIERPHHTTYDIRVGNGFVVRLEEEALVDKIRSTQM